MVSLLAAHERLAAGLAVGHREAGPAAVADPADDEPLLVQPGPNAPPSQQESFISFTLPFKKCLGLRCGSRHRSWIAGLCSFSESSK